MGTDRKSETFRPLTRQEIDRRIDEVIVAVVCQGDESIQQGKVSSVGEPEWISAAEFVKRMSRFLVYN